MRLLFCGDMGGTGFGTVTIDLGAEMLALGMDIRFLSMNEAPTRDGLPAPFRDRTALLGEKTGWLALDEASLPQTRDRLKSMFEGGLFEDGWKPDATLIVGDVASLKMSPILPILPEGHPTYFYVPVEGIGLPPSWKAVFDRVQPVAMCDFGAGEIERLTGRRPPVVYHGVNTTDFKPINEISPVRLVGRARPDGTITRDVVIRSRAEARKFLGWPQDDFIMFRADRHMPRKQYPALLRAVAPVLEVFPRARLIWHCLSVDQGGDLLDERSKYPQPIADRMNSTGLHDEFGGVPRSILRIMYAAADLYVSTSAEGFGLTIAEAMACGTPVVGLDFSSVPEVIGPGGWTVPVGYLVENVYSHWWASPDQKQYATTLHWIIKNKHELGVRGKAGLLHVQRNFRWSVAAQQMQAIVDPAEAEAAA
jgi:glycosyltransferase involved in cell wall biosynthesis